jgi:hypothetical protein
MRFGGRSSVCDNTQKYARRRRIQRQAILPRSARWMLGYIDSAAEASTTSLARRGLREGNRRRRQNGISILVYMQSVGEEEIGDGAWLLEDGNIH